MVLFNPSTANPSTFGIPLLILMERRSCPDVVEHSWAGLICMSWSWGGCIVKSEWQCGYLGRAVSICSRSAPDGVLGRTGRSISISTKVAPGTAKSGTLRDVHMYLYIPQRETW